jgi:hypothetical protein
LLFTQDLPHEGSRVEQGIEHAVRTKVACRLGDSWNWNVTTGSPGREAQNQNCVSTCHIHRHPNSHVFLNFLAHSHWQLSSSAWKQDFLTAMDQHLLLRRASLFVSWSQPQWIFLSRSSWVAIVFPGTLHCHESIQLHQRLGWGVSGIFNKIPWQNIQRTHGLRNVRNFFFHFGFFVLHCQFVSRMQISPRTPRLSRSFLFSTFKFELLDGPASSVCR